LADEFVEVTDLTIYFRAAGPDGRLAAERFTLRPGDVFAMDQETGMVMIRFAPRDLMVGGELRRHPPVQVQYTNDAIAGMRKDPRFEPKVRPSVASILNPTQAAVESAEAKIVVVK